jgi:hypothetical protein
VTGARFARILIIAALFTFTPYGSAHAENHATQTVSHVFVAVDGNGKLRHGLKVIERSPGKCWINSIVTNRPDAWRCMSAHWILDPCFMMTYTGHYVACILSPFSSSVRLLRLTAPLPQVNASQAGTGAPWAIRLRSGAQCVMAAGATTVVAGMRANYFCNNSNAILFGLPNTQGQVWRIFSGTRANSDLVEVNIAEAIY